MRTKKDTLEIVDLLKKEYVVGECGLDFTEPWQLLVAVRLSAQCTDKRVNVVTPVLFEKYPSLKHLSLATVEEIGEVIRSCGFYNSKARDISLASKMLVDVYDSRIPDTMDELLSIPGVGRKSANLILGDIYGKPAIVADTHCIRISNRLGFIKSTNPYKVELALVKVVPPEESNNFCHRLVLHGREVCTARKAHCERCCLQEICRKIIK